MRGSCERQVQLFCCVDIESRIPSDHPIRALKKLCERALKSLSCALDGMYSETGRPSVPPERLLKSQLLIALYSVRSDRMFCERLNWDMLFRWFLDMNLEEAGFDATSFTKNRTRLLEHEIGKLFLEQVVGMARDAKLLSEAHFTVDGTLIEAWASMKSFRPRDDQDSDGESFHGERRSNETHQSKTDGEARLYRKGPGKESKLCYSMNILTENRHGLIVDLTMETADGYSERRAAMNMLNRQCDEHGRNPKSVGADKAYHCADFVQSLRDMNIRPHVACRSDRQVIGLDRRTTRHRSYELSQRARKLVEQPFGWMKAFAGFRKSRFVGRARTELFAQFTAATYNLLRIAKLLPT